MFIQWNLSKVAWENNKTLSLLNSEICLKWPGVLLFFLGHFRKFHCIIMTGFIIFPGHFRQVSLYNHDRVLLCSQVTLDKFHCIIMTGFIIFPGHFRPGLLYNPERDLLFFPDHFKQVSLYNHEKVFYFPRPLSVKLV
jgi:hypothetical protein